MANKIYLFFIIIFFLLLFLIFYKGLQNSSIYTPSVDINKNVPTFNAKIFDSEETINSKKIFQDDKFYLINIWASWCVPCRDEHSFLMHLKNQKNLEIVGLNYKDNNKNARNFLKELDNPYKIILLDNDGTIAIEWGAYGVPESFLIYNKKIIKKIVGPLNEVSLIEIKKLIE